MTLKELLKEIQPVQTELRETLLAQIDDLAHPPGSLGRLEETVVRIGMITNSLEPETGRKVIFTFGADHGVWDEDVSTQPQSVTTEMVETMCAGNAAINILARQSGAENRIVDVGVNSDFPENMPNLIQRKIRKGTANMAKGPAMTEAEAEQAVMVGAELATEEIDKGATLLGTGEMGICNTTASAALFAALLPCPVEAVTGRGSGVNNQKLKHKAEVIKQALEANHECLETPMGALAAVGGLEIAAIAGMILGAASRKVPVVVDGFISSAGALAACRLCPAVADYLFYSHRSAEIGHSVFLEHFGHRPLLDLDMRLGEGTGAALAMNIIEGALRCYLEMPRFSDTNNAVSPCTIEPDT
ncbi:MAG: nicotinate-nucleotide--dimethylbenzimidazole phosphoribosyltransferase [Verrucomicrobiota bacterium]